MNRRLAARICVGWAAPLVLLALLFGGGSVAVAQVPSSTAEVREQYALGPSDKFRLNIFQEPDLSGDFEISGSGTVSLPLLGQIQAAGLSVPELETKIADRLKEGFLVFPRVSIQVLNYRPFYILGEVNNPGSYSFVEGMTFIQAVTIAGGFTHRARQSTVEIQRGDGTDRKEMDMAITAYVLPGDIIRVKERFF